MSANNYILVNRRTFSVSMRDAEEGKLMWKIGKGKTLDEALDIAQKTLEEEIVEYGIQLTKIKKI